MAAYYCKRLDLFTGSSRFLIATNLPVRLLNSSAVRKTFRHCRHPNTVPTRKNLSTPSGKGVNSSDGTQNRLSRISLAGSLLLRRESALVQRIETGTRCFLHTTPPAASGDKFCINIETVEGTVTLEAKDGDSILDVVTNNNHEILGYGVCDGTVACSTCRVELRQEDFSRHENTLTIEERDLLDMCMDPTDLSRLGCQVCLDKRADGMTVFVPDPVDLRAVVDGENV